MMRSCGASTEVYAMKLAGDPERVCTLTPQSSESRRKASSARSWQIVSTRSVEKKGCGGGGAERRQVREAREGGRGEGGVEIAGLQVNRGTTTGVRRVNGGAWRGGGDL